MGLAEDLMAVTMNHFTILTDDVDATIRFYGELLDLHPGARPNFDFPGAWLYSGDAAILHIVGGRPKTELRAGVIDHMAFTGRDLPNTLKALDARGITHTCRRQVGSGTWQVFFHDVNGAKVELDFDASETAPGH
jgi:catechol 2,3-dioxygenase-like lactoylglutathione lyase family enzyme